MSELFACVTGVLIVHASEILHRKDIHALVKANSAPTMSHAEDKGLQQQKLQDWNVQHTLKSWRVGDGMTRTVGG